MEDKIPQKTCLACRGSFNFGLHVYDGKPAWGEWLCTNCLKANEGGFVPGSYKELDAHLERIGMAHRNDKGFIPLP